MTELDNTRAMTERFLDPQTAEPQLNISESRDFQQTFVDNTVSGSNGDGAEFEPALNFPTGSSSYSVAVGDFDGDGNIDLATANRNSYYGGGNSVSILLGDGAGNFSEATDFTINGNPFAVDTGDFDGDGKLDLVTANYDYAGGTVSILLGDGTGSFGEATTFAAGAGNYSVDVGDFNGDGFDDLSVATGTYNPGSVAVLLADGTGGFNAATNFDTGNDPEDVSVADFNGDGNLDLVTANESYDRTVSVLLGDGAGNFSSATNFDTVDEPRSVTEGDFNGDGNLDLATTNFVYNYYGSSSSISVLLGDGAGNFSEATSFATTGSSVSIETGDFDLDGNLDLVTADGFNNSVSVLLGDGAGNFGSSSDFATGGNSFAVAVGAFNGDGSLDLVTANGYSQSVSVLLNAVVPGVELIGTEGNDVLTGGNGSDTIEGLGGNDIIQGLGRNDTISGGSGNDLIAAGDGNDSVSGNQGNDRISGNDGNDTISGNEGVDNILGGEGNDSISGGTQRDRLLGEAGDDTLLGEAGSDTLDGGDGNDSVSGGTNNDQLFGSTGNDSLFGEAGNDTLDGGLGNDLQEGGDGNDQLLGVNKNAANAGISELDTLAGGNGRDTFWLGDANGVYYDDGDALTTGDSDYALIRDFNQNEDFIQLQGTADLYSLDFFTSAEGSQNAVLIYDSGTTARGETIGILENVDADLSVSDPAFTFV